jgi:hypothetical protein
MSAERLPVYLGFEYRVELGVRIPLAWTEFLRVVAQHHYDWECRESAKCGVINGLYNTSCYSSTYAVGWTDLDHLAKVMEQAGCHVNSEQSQQLVNEISTWIRQAQKWISARSEGLKKWDTEQGTPMPCRSE